MGFNPVDLALGNMNALRMSNARLKAENAKLRELVWDMWAMRTPQIDFETYTAFRDRMRELGVDI